MRSGSIRLALWIAAFVAVLGSFLILNALDLSAPLAVRATVQVSGPSPRVRSEETIDVISEVAQANRVNITKNVADVQDPGGARHVYVAVGNPAGGAASWINHGYPSFNTSMRTTVGRMGDLAGSDPRGTYYVFDGSATSAVDMQRELRDQGYSVLVKTSFLGSYAQWVIGRPVGVSLVVALLLCATLAGGFSLMNAKGYAVQRLHGAGPLVLMGRDIKANAAACLLGMCVVATVVCGPVMAYNHGAQWSLFGMLSAVIFLAVCVVMAAAYGVGFAIASAEPLLSAVKGRLPCRLPSIMVYCVRVPAVFITIWAVTLLFTALGDLHNQQQAQEAWRDAGGVAQVHLNPNLSPEEQDEYSRKTGEWLERAEDEGRMVLAHEDDLRFMSSPADDGQTVSGTVLLVNGNYLRHQTVKDDDGHRLTAGGDGVTVVIPYAADAAATKTYENAIGSWVQSRTSARGIAVPEIDYVRGDRGQQLFSYGSALPDTPALFDDALLVVADNDSGLFSTDDYAAYASQGDALLESTRYALVSSRQAGLKDFIFAVNDAGQSAAAHYAQLRSDLIVHVYNVAMSVIVLIASAVAIAQIRVRERAQTIFARYIHGWSFTRTHLSLVMVESALMAAPCIWFAAQTVRAAGRIVVSYAQNDPSLLDGYQPLLAMLIAVTSFAVCMLSTAIYVRRNVQAHTREE
ncbi:hypothetical protein [Bifidobacterium miconisargentati]|uniref:hypothetical protein n=1 Tax=Bifidobacterium miconisargentati TaxID=2834437 RepID=UPI001BDBD433|nr:hypothetical protein [Bifidobacterium miconisargentati]MBW3090199.1 hypothetical protein [Bifidobacterium miconisargentati]